MIPLYDNTCFFNCAFHIIRGIRGLSFDNPSYHAVYRGEWTEEVVKKAIEGTSGFEYGEQGDAMEFLNHVLTSARQKDLFRIFSEEKIYVCMKTPIPVLRGSKEFVRRSVEGWYVRIPVEMNTSCDSIQSLIERERFELEGVPMDFSDSSFEKDDYVYDGERHLRLSDVVKYVGFAMESGTPVAEKTGGYLFGSTRLQYNAPGNYVIVNLETVNHSTGEKTKLRVVNLFNRIQLGDSFFKPTVMVTHLGSLSSGHYVSYILGDDSKWSLVNGKNILTYAPGHSLLGTPYCILYERLQKVPLDKSPPPSERPKVL